jgi:transposase
MKKNITVKKTASAKKRGKKALGQGEQKRIRQESRKQKLTVGMDLGDRSCRYAILDETGEMVSEGTVETSKKGLASVLGKMAASRVAIEVGTHSPWISRYLAEMGHEVIVANTHQVKLITKSVRKTDRRDALQLARLARVDTQLLSPIQHRGEEVQKDLGVIRARADLVEARTKLINSARGLVKPLGERLKGCDAEQVGVGLGKELSKAGQRVVGPLLRAVEAMSEEIRGYDEQIEEMEKRYPRTKLLKQVYGVGELIGLTYVLTLEDPGRFMHSRDVGPYLGLTRKLRESGEQEPELGISKAGDKYLRSLMVQAAHCILRKGAPDSDLREWGLRKAVGGKRAKRRAIVAVARKLAVLLHHLWASGEVYDPLYNRKAAAKAQANGKVAA